MSGKITRVLREYVFILSILIMIPAVFFIFMGIVFNFFISITEQEGSMLYFIKELDMYNDYILIAGLIILGIGVYYLYSFLTKRKYVLDELKTDKRSEIMKKRIKLQATVKHLPSKYKEMLLDKEDELGIK